MKNLLDRRRAGRSVAHKPGSEKVELDRFFALSPDLMVVARPEGQFVEVNPAFEHALGYSLEELFGRTVTDLVHPDDCGSTEAVFRASTQGERVAGFENRYRAKDGAYRWLLWSAILAEDGLVYATARDISERKKMQDELRASREQAREAARLKSEFIATMSHEIRTPLNGVVGMTELLRDTPLTSVQVEYVDALGVSGEALLAVIGDVLDFSKLEAGFLELDRTDFELRAAVEGACQMVAGEAHSKGLEIGHWVAVDVPSVVNGDRARLRQILLSLLSNAVKFTTSGEIALRVWRERADLLQFSVSDTGIGIDGDPAALFEAFAQADQSTTREHGGTGLGLAISRQLVELMGGRIAAHPREGGGSTFSFSARLSDANGPEQPGPSRRDLRGVRTLIVDDNSSNRRTLEHYFQEWGAVYESVDRPSAAIKVLESASREGHPFALAMLAFNMPRMDGMGLLREIRERQALDELRIVVLAPGRLDVEEFSDPRVSQVLKKPAAQSLIYEAAAGSLSRTAPGVERAAAIETASSALSQLILVVEDNEINRTVVTALLNKLGLQVAVARNGREAIEMAGEHDYDAILMDCLMPEIDGFQATRQIREDEGALHVPIVAMTALSMPGDRERCFAAGMDDYLSKPIRGTALEAVIERWLPTERSRAGTEAVGDGDAGASSPVEGVLDRPAITRLRDTLTPTACRQLLEIFDEQQEKCVTDITDAVTRGDREEVRRVAHLLKGSSATLGATSLRLCCERLEHIDATQPREVTEAQLVELRRVAAESNDALRAQLI